MLVFLGTVSIPSGGIFVFLQDIIVNYTVITAVSIPSGGIFVFLRVYNDFDRNYYDMFQSRLAGFLFFYLTIHMIRRDFMSVSIPSGGIFVFLHTSDAPIPIIRPVEFQSRLAGFLFFYHRYFDAAWPPPSFNPVWRDFCFSTAC